VILLFVTSCKREYNFPSKTREGKNTFAYSAAGTGIGGKFNGENDEVIVLDSSITINHYRANNRKHHPKEWNLKINLKRDAFDMFKLGTATFHYASYQVWTNYIEPITNATNYCHVTYFSKEKGIVSGEFSFNLVQIDSAKINDSTWVLERLDSINISRGRFDLKF